MKFSKLTVSRENMDPIYVKIFVSYCGAQQADHLGSSLPDSAITPYGALGDLHQIPRPTKSLALQGYVWALGEVRSSLYAPYRWI